MAKTTINYWNPLSAKNREQWTPIKGLEGMAEELILSIDQNTGEYTRLTRFYPGTDTTLFGSKSHEYPEEIFIVRSEDSIIYEGLTQDFCSSSRRSNRRIAGYSTVATTQKMDKKTSQDSYIIESSLLSGRLYDQAFRQWLETGYYASRPPGELHGPFKTDDGCVVLEISFPNKSG